MRTGTKLIAAALISLSLTACAGTVAEETVLPVSTPEPTQTQPLDGLVGVYMPDWSFCVEAFQAERVTCSVGYTVENPTDAPVEILYASVYAVVDGKIFKADADQGDGIADVSTNWNPGDKFKASTVFTVPSGATIEQVFFADEPDVGNAEMIFDVGLLGTPS